MAYDSLEKALDRIGQEKKDDFDGLCISDNLALLMENYPIIDQVFSEDHPYDQQVKEILQAGCQKLGLDAGKMEQELQAARECDGFLLSNDMSPTGRVMSFMCSKKLGPTAQGLYDALKLNQPLTDEQKLILEKICPKMGHPDWYEIIVEGIEEEIAAREQGYEQQSPASDGGSLPGMGRLPGDQ